MPEREGIKMEKRGAEGSMRGDKGGKKRGGKSKRCGREEKKRLIIEKKKKKQEKCKEEKGGTGVRGSETITGSSERGGSERVRV